MTNQLTVQLAGLSIKHQHNGIMTADHQPAPVGGEIQVVDQLAAARKASHDLHAGQIPVTDQVAHPIAGDQGPLIMGQGRRVYAMLVVDALNDRASRHIPDDRPAIE